MSWSLSAVLISASFALGQAGDPATTESSSEEIRRAVRNLGHEQYTVREEASRRLLEAGRAAEPALLEAVQGDDPEVVARARRILRRFMLGIYPDTPPAVVDLIGRFYYGDNDAKHAALDQLMGMGQLDTVLKLLQAEPNETLRRTLTKNLAKDLDTVGGGLFLAGNWSKAEQLLELGAIDDRGMRNHAAYLLLRGKIDEAIDVRQRAAGSTDALQRRAAVYLLRARGDLPGALHSAEKLGDAELVESLLFELGDWQRLADIYDKKTRRADGSLAGNIVDLGFAAAYHRLAGNQQGLDAVADAIHGLAEAKPNKLRDCAEALLINERYDEAIELYRRHGSRLEFDLLYRQGRYGDALRAIGVEDLGAPLVPWLDEAWAPDGDPFGAAPKRFSLGLRVAPVLARLDRDEEAGELLEELARAALDNRELSMPSVCGAEMKMGLVDAALRHAALTLDRQNNVSLLRVLFPDHAEAAVVWWTWLRQAEPDSPAADALQRMQALLGPGESKTGQGWRESVAAVEKASRALDANKRQKWLAALADTSLIHGDRGLAREYLEKAAAVTPSSAICFRLGDAFTEQAAHGEAAAWYRRAWEIDSKQPLGLYLAGLGLQRSGDDEEGSRLIQVAELAPLGNESLRYRLAKGLYDRQLEDEAARHWEWILRTGEFRSWSVNEAGKYVGNRVSPSQPGTAADYWQRLLLGCLRTSTRIVDVGAYLKVIYVIHKARARGLLAEGHGQEAFDELMLAQAAMPGDSQLAIDMVPKLDEAGEKGPADELFERIYAVEEQVCREFPDSPRARNNLAWLAARCNRRLDAALVHAGKATAAEPDNPAYLDTLAEVHYRRGEAAKAIELARRCMELEPDRQYYEQQLKRFEAGEP